MSAVRLQICKCFQVSDCADDEGIFFNIIITNLKDELKTGKEWWQDDGPSYVHCPLGGTIPRAGVKMYVFLGT